jgi:hypothetical protein
VVAEDIESPKVIVEGESEVRKDSDGLFIDNPHHLFYPIPCKNLNLDTLIFENIGPIVEMKRGLESIGVCQEGYSRNKTEGDEMTEGKGSCAHYRFGKSELH